MKRIAVTGCSGYLGCHVVRHLISEGYEVAGFDIREPQDEDFRSHGKFRFTRGDITRKDAVLDAFIGADAIVHCAAALAQFVRNKDEMFRINVTGTENVVSACEILNIKTFIFISSVEVYGIDVPVPCNEDAALTPVCPYGEHKVRGERMCRDLADRGVAVAVLRPPTINGPGQNEPFLVNQFEAVFSGKPVILPGGGRSRLQMVHVSDVAAAISLCLKKIEKGIFIANIASDNVPTLRELVESLFSHAEKEIKVLPVPAGLARGVVRALSLLGISPLEPQHLEIALRDYMFDNSRAKKHLGWGPTRNDIETAVEAYDYHIQRMGESK